MDAIKTLALIIVICVSSSVGATYIVVDNIKQSDIDNLENYYDSQMNNLESVITYYENETLALNEQLGSTNDRLSEVQQELEQTNISLQENISELEKLQSGDKYQLHDPTYYEVSRFIASDTTDEIPYNNETFDCEDFCHQINNNAENRGIRCAYVVLYFYDTNTGHAIIGFNTIDREMVYVEPQSDEWVENLEVGNDYWTDCVVPKGGYYYEDAPNDTIKEILIFW